MIASRILRRLFQASFVLAALGHCAGSRAATVAYTSSTAFDSAVQGGFVVENYGSGVAGTTIASGSVFDGLTYSFTAGPFGTLLGGIITNQFNARNSSGTSLGGNQSIGVQFFFGGDSVTISFATPIDAFGAFFNVNLNPGSYEVTSAVGSAVTDSVSYDTSTFVFAGLTSNTPFSSVTLTSTDPSLGAYNVAEIDYQAFTAVPEPISAVLFASGMIGTVFVRRRRPSPS